MPSLQWSSKSTQEPITADLQTDSVLFPHPGLSDVDQSANQLILGDNLRVMSALLPEYENKIDLIYVDPPFFTNKGYTARIGRGEDSRKPEEWQLVDGYKDEWDGLNDYLDMLFPRLQLMHRLLSPTGSLYLHLDWHANSYARILMDEIFGYKNYRNEIIWTYHGPSPIKRAFNRKHDMILFYSKTDKYKFNVDDVRIPYASNTVETFKSSDKAGFGKVPDLDRGKVPEDWWYFPVVARLHNERTGYPTQKPEALMERIIMASSDPGDLVADFFGGAGTTAVVAQRLGRRFVLSDNQPRAINTSRSRLVSVMESLDDDLRVSKFTRIQRESHFPEAEILDFSSLGLPEPTRDGGKVALPPSLISQVDYWEIDPAWQEGTFNSKYQVVRPLRKGEIVSEIELDVHQPGRVCVRVLLVTGDLAQLVL